MFVNDQWRTEPSPLETITPQPSARGGSSTTLPAVTDLDSELYQQELQYLSAACPEFRSSDLAKANPSDNIFCGAYIADSNQLCRRVNTLQSLLEVNREMASAERTGAFATLNFFITGLFGPASEEKCSILSMLFVRSKYEPSRLSSIHRHAGK